MGVGASRRLAQFLATFFHWEKIEQRETGRGDRARWGDICFVLFLLSSFPPSNDWCACCRQGRVFSCKCWSNLPIVRPSFAGSRHRNTKNCQSAKRLYETPWLIPLERRGRMVQYWLCNIPLMQSVVLSKVSKTKDPESKKIHRIQQLVITFIDYMSRSGGTRNKSENPKQAKT